MPFSRLNGTRGIAIGIEADQQQNPGQVDAPALVDRVAAIHELAETRLDEGPAGAVAEATQASRSSPVHTASMKAQRISGGTIQMTSAIATMVRMVFEIDEKRLVRSQPTAPTSPGGGASAGSSSRAHKDRVGGGHLAQRSTRATRRLNQFMKSDVARLIAR